MPGSLQLSPLLRIIFSLSFTWLFSHFLSKLFLIIIIPFHCLSTYKSQTSSSTGFWKRRLPFPRWRENEGELRDHYRKTLTRIQGESVSSNVGNDLRFPADNGRAWLTFRVLPGIFIDISTGLGTKSKFMRVLKQVASVCSVACPWKGGLVRGSEERKGMEEKNPGLSCEKERQIGGGKSKGRWTVSRRVTKQMIFLVN